MNQVQYLFRAGECYLKRKTGYYQKHNAKDGSYGGRAFVTAQKGNDEISRLLRESKPFMAGRLGSVELAFIRECEEKELGIRKALSEGCVENLKHNAGFFCQKEEQLPQFFSLMKESLSACDLLGVWYNPMEEYFVRAYAKETLTSPLRAIEPWYHENPWSRFLEGKKVLVIHPFAESIEAQYQNRERIFPDGLLPAFELRTVKAVQTIAGNKDERFADWFQALDYMLEKAAEADFDVAIIGCGAYGFPLAAKLKAQGRAAVHMGGATQLLFGIKGKRWDNHEIISRLYNDAWVRPSGQETVSRSGEIEGGCYW